MTKPSRFDVFVKDRPRPLHILMDHVEHGKDETWFYIEDTMVAMVPTSQLVAIQRVAAVTDRSQETPAETVQNGAS